MRTLIIGGSGSGKSVYAEGVSMALSGGGPLWYLATMAAWDGESLRRISRHREQRAGKGFRTVEKSRGLSDLTLTGEETVLLEDLGNLAANELYAPGSVREQALLLIDAGLAHLERNTKNLVVVGNAVFSDGCRYETETMEYIRLLAQVQNRLATRFEQVVEVVCGIPVFWKGEGI